MGALSRGINRALVQLTQLNPQENGERAKSKEADNGPLSRRRLRDKGERWLMKPSPAGKDKPIENQPRNSVGIISVKMRSFD
jgi:hypothetical protein